MITISNSPKLEEKYSLNQLDYLNKTIVSLLNDHTSATILNKNLNDGIKNVVSLLNYKIYDFVGYIGLLDDSIIHESDYDIINKELDNIVKNTIFEEKYESQNIYRVIMSPLEHFKRGVPVLYNVSYNKLDDVNNTFYKITLLLKLQHLSHALCRELGKSDINIHFPTQLLPYPKELVSFLEDYFYPKKYKINENNILDYCIEYVMNESISKFTEFGKNKKDIREYITNIIDKNLQITNIIIKEKGEKLDNKTIKNSYVLELDNHYSEYNISSSKEIFENINNLYEGTLFNISDPIYCKMESRSYRVYTSKEYRGRREFVNSIMEENNSNEKDSNDSKESNTIVSHNNKRYKKIINLDVIEKIGKSMKYIDVVEFMLDITGKDHNSNKKEFIKASEIE